MADSGERIGETPLSAIRRPLSSNPRGSMSEDLKRTPLADIHRALGGKMVPFAGWEMPVQYPTGIMAEHQAVRTGTGIFDVSHMGEFEVTGPDRNRSEERRVGKGRAA